MAQRAGRTRRQVLSGVRPYRPLRLVAVRGSVTTPSTMQCCVVVRRARPTSQDHGHLDQVAKLRRGCIRTRRCVTGCAYLELLENYAATADNMHRSRRIIQTPSLIRITAGHRSSPSRPTIACTCQVTDTTAVMKRSKRSVKHTRNGRRRAGSSPLAKWAATGRLLP